jgi:subtilisin family serine protease
MSRTRSRGRSRLTIAALALALVGGLTGTASAYAGGQARSAADDLSAIRMNYVVNTGTGAAAIKAAEEAVKAEGGKVLISYSEVGIVIAQSSKGGFAKALRGSKYDKIVDSVGATRTAEAPPPKIVDEYGPFAAAKLKPDPREGEQWGNTVLQSLKANKIQPGDPKVLVGDLDTGVDDTHPDLTANFDKKNSVSCENNGVPDTSDGAWRPTSSTHGTHTAGTIAAARDGQGIAGIAPKISIASIKITDDNGFIYPEYAICGFMWAASHGVDVTNNSYFIDPWFFWCKNDPDQGAVQESIKRVLAYTFSKDIVTVASAGNSGYDLGKQTHDSSSPNDGTPFDRPLNKHCLKMPTQMANVITVSATTSTGDKAGFSNFGKGQVDVAAPGNAILSTTWPGHGWGLLSGTSMAAPHVTGLVALVRSQFPDASASQVMKIVAKTAEDTPCPPSTPACEGTKKYNGYFGDGIVNALRAVKNK